MNSTVINKPTDEQMATVGPIEGKPKDQAAAHRIVVLRNTWDRMDTSWHHWLEQLGKVREARLWEFYPTEQPYGSLPDLLKANGIDPSIALRKESFEGRYIQEDGTNTLKDRPGGLQHNNRDDSGKFAKPDSNPHCYVRNNVDSPERGNSADYWLARLERDAPEYHRKYNNHEYESVAAACYDAGIRKKEQRLHISIDPESAGRYLAGRVDADWMLACYDAFMKAIEVNHE